MNKRNYQKELEKLIDQVQKDNKVPSLFLHSCCAPCSSYVLEYLSKYFNITVFYYNPNIYPEEEYRKRVHEITRLVNSMEFIHPVKLVEGHYDPQEFFQMAKGMEDVPEGGERCFKCYRLRMEEAAKLAEEGIDAKVINIHTIKPLDEELVVAAAKETGKVVTVEEHSIIGGLGGAVCECLAEKAPVPVKRIGINDVYGESGPAVALLEKYGLDAAGIYKQIKAFI